MQTQLRFPSKLNTMPIGVAARQFLEPAAPARVQAGPIFLKAARPERPTRKTSHLQPDARFLIQAALRSKDFLYFYNNRTSAKNPQWTWASLITQVFFPTMPQVDLRRHSVKDSKGMQELLSEMWTDSGASAGIRLKKENENQRFLVEVPVMALNGLPDSSEYNYGIAVPVCLAQGKPMSSLISSDDFKNDLRRISSELAPASLNGRSFLLDKLVAKGNLSEKDVLYFKETRAILSFRTIGKYLVAYVTFEVSKIESEYLCNSSWLEIRSIDIYGPIRAWILGYFGKSGRSPKFAIPLGKIAKGVPPDSPSRASAEGVIVDQQGVYYALPEKTNAINKYEDGVTASMSRPSGWFSIIPDDGEGSSPKLPTASPVFLDWANNKFAYTSLDGHLQVMHLERVIPLNITHVRRFLERKCDTDVVRNFVTMTNSLAESFGLPVDRSKDFFAELVRSGERRDDYREEAEIPLHCVYQYSTNGIDTGGGDDEASPFFKNFVDTARKTKNFIEENPYNAYARYSVPNVCELLAQLKMFVQYAPKYTEVKAQDNAKRKSYINQGEKPNFQLEQVPFIEPERGLMPHQVKVSGILSEDPDNAMIPVDAGGGKTPLVVYDVLKEIKRNPGLLRLVMCPAHLVSAYVKEFSYFTGSRMNVIPVTGYTFRRHGLDRLRTMILQSPANTIVVSDYNIITLKANDLSYGTTPIRVFPMVEFLRQFDFKYVACDESHYLRSGSNRAQAVARLIVDIPKKRLASGTMVSDTIVDLVRQVALMDPTIFGSVDDFIKTYAQEVRGSKVLQWKEGTELLVDRLIRENVVVAGAKRKEWAAILPVPVERFHPISLTDAQRVMYSTILDEQIARLMEDAQRNAKLSAFLRGESEDEEGVPLDIDALLKPYLARLERFITAPNKDILGASLQGDDAVSAKAKEIVRICKGHLDEKIPGKILIFTNYTLSAEAIYEAFPADMQDMVIHYTAGRKEECGSQFEKDPKKMIMVGVSSSMDTGLNLQFCSRLIRTETVWTPGTLEQGNSRIGRPNIKDKEGRKHVYFDWLVANQTIDVTKVAYLMAKTISKAKYDEAGNPRFDTLEVPPLFSMTIDTIREGNDWDTTMVDYFTQYEAFRQAIHAEYAEFREKNKTAMFNPNGSVKMQEMKRAENPPDSAIMMRVPYVPGTELYGAKDLGLIRYDEFMRIEVEPEGEGEEDEEVGEDEDSEEGMSDPEKQALLAEKMRAVGLGVHTDRGDGEIVRVSKRRVTVILPSGERISVHKLSTFVITRANTSNKDIRTQLLKLHGDIPIDAPIEVLETKITPAMQKKLDKKKRDEEGAEEVVEDQPTSLELEFTIVNDFLGLRLRNSSDDAAVSIAQNFGFKHAPAHYAAEIRVPIQFYKLFSLWKEAGMEIDAENNAACRAVYQNFKTKGKGVANLYGVALENEIRNFYRTEFRPNPNKKHINPFPIIQDGKVFVALPKNGQPGSVAAMRIARPMGGLRWFEYDGEDDIVAFVPTKNKASALIKKMLDAGVLISNLEEMKEQFRTLRIARTTEA